MDFMPVTSRIKVPRIDYEKNKEYYVWIHVAHWVDIEGFNENRWRPEYRNFHWPCKKGEDEWETNSH